MDRANSEERHQLLGLLQWHYVFLEYSQDHKFLLKEIKKVVDSIRPENIVQIVTDNGSNYKKACKLLGREFPHIV